MKVIILTIGLLCLSQAVHIGRGSSTDAHLLEQFGHDSSLSHSEETHDNAAAVSAVIAGLSLLKDIFGPSFEVTCKNGYKRSNNINVLNLTPDTLRLEDTYIDSGKLLKSGASLLPSKKSDQWLFSKKSGSATGSTGSMVWVLPSLNRAQANNIRVGLIFESPWSAYNFVGICIFKDTGVTAENYYKYMYNKYNRSECAYLDNSKSKKDYFYANTTLTANGYTAGLALKYEYIDGCYIQEIDLAIGKA